MKTGECRVRLSLKADTHTHTHTHTHQQNIITSSISSPSPPYRLARWNWLAAPYLAELCRPVVHLAERRHLRSAASGKLDVQRTATDRRSFTVSGPEIWNSLTADLRLSKLLTANFARRLTAHLFTNTE